MRNFLIFLAVITALYLWQRNRASDSLVAKDQSTKSVVISTANPTPRPLGEASEHNWMKRSLDRATEVRNMSRNQTRDSQNP